MIKLLSSTNTASNSQYKPLHSHIRLLATSRFAIIKKAIIFAVVYLLIFANQVEATSPPPIVLKPVIGFMTAQEAISTLLSVVGYVGGLLCFFYLVWGAYKYLTAGDNPSNTAAARQTMINAVIGLVLLGLVVVIFQFVSSFIPGLDDAF